VVIPPGRFGGIAEFSALIKIKKLDINNPNNKNNIRLFFIK